MRRDGCFTQKEEKNSVLFVNYQDLVKEKLQALEGNVPKPTRRTWEDYFKEKVLKV
jgi:hypothetical protein